MFQKRLSSLNRLVVPVVAALAGAACTPPDSSPEAVFEELWRNYDEMYGCFDLRDVDWDEAYERFRPQVDSETNEDELFDVVAAMLAETDDGHIHLTTPGRQRWSANRIYRESIGFDRFDRDLVRDEYLGGDVRSDPIEEYILGDLGGGITYVHFAWISDQFPILPVVREQAEAGGGGLVIDLRHNGGGDFTWAFHALGDWTSTDRPVFRTRTRNGPGRDDFTPWFDWSIEASGTDIDFPVVVLIDRFTISAGERTVLALDALDNVTFLGEPTNGAISTTVGRELSNGWLMMASTQEVLGLDGSSIEGIGFAPDELIVNDPEIMAAGVDQVLERAIEVLEGAG
jgi:hypothetical protein